MNKTELDLTPAALTPKRYYGINRKTGKLFNGIDFGASDLSDHPCPLPLSDTEALVLKYAWENVEIVLVSDFIPPVVEATP